jgi:phospholipid/cholesterol/gamma-HCH transport system substrate-binding protein
VKTTAAAVKLSIFIVVTLIATGLLAGTIGNLRFGGTRDYRALFTDVTGLLKGDDIRISGVRVGSVESIKVVKGNLAEVRFSVDDDQRLAVSTRATVRYRNLVGQRYIALSEGAGPSTPLKAGATIPLEQTQPALDLTVLFNGFKPLFAALSPREVNELAFEIIKTLQGEGGSINSLLAHTGSLTSALADRDEVIGRTVENLNSVLASIDERDERLSSLIVDLQRFVSGLAEDRTAIGESLTSIADLAEATSGVVEDIRPPLRNDIRALGEVTRTLDDNKAIVDETLKVLPDKINKITRTATYGSWFNFYLCEFSIKGHPTEKQPGSRGRCPA